jgi:toxin ParE1/3/4
MPRVIWSDRSRSDLAAIGDYIADHDPAAALRTLHAIRAKAVLLAQFPNIGPPLDGERRYLRIPPTPYLIVYRIGPGRVEVLGIRHAREDWWPQDPAT